MIPVAQQQPSQLPTGLTLNTPSPIAVSHIDIGARTHNNGIDLTIRIDFINNRIVAGNGYTYTHSSCIYKETPLCTGLNACGSDPYSKDFTYSNSLYSVNTRCATLQHTEAAKQPAPKSVLSTLYTQSNRVRTQRTKDPAVGF
jgi:hypothetical protein